MTDHTKENNQDLAKNLKVKGKKKTNQPISDITDVEFFLAFCLAILKDVLDWILLFAGGIGLILSRITNLLITGILWLWCISRLHKFPTKRFIGGFVIEMIPVVGTIAPTWTIFIATIWGEEKGHIPKWVSKLAKGKI